MPKTFANPTYDTAFKRLFGNIHHANLTKDFLNTILNRTSENLITDITFVNTEKTPRFNREKKTYIDIQCIDAAGNEFIIEMQSSKEDYFAQRVQYYVAHGLSRQLEKTNLYIQLKPVIFIGVLGFNLFESSGKKDVASPVITHHFITNQLTQEQDLDLMEFHFIELLKFKKTETQLETEVDRWLYFLKKAGQLDDIPTSCAQSAPIKEAFDLMERANWNVDDWRIYEEERKLQMYFATQDYAAQEKKDKIEQLEFKIKQENEKLIEKNEKLIKEKEKLIQKQQQAVEEKEKAIQEKQQAVEEVEQQAQEKVMQEKIHTALNFLRMGLAIEQISQGTGLTVEQIEKLTMQK